MMDDDMKKDVDKKKADSASVKKDNESYQARLRILVAKKWEAEKVMPPVCGGAASSSCDGAPKAHVSGIALPAPKRARKYGPKVDLVGKVTAEQVEAQCPWGSSVYADTLDSSWRCCYHKKKLSKAWRLYGVDGAAQEIVKMVWVYAISMGYERDCPFAELCIGKKPEV